MKSSAMAVGWRKSWLTRRRVRGAAKRSGEVAVLGILGLFGALVAGIMAETMIGSTPAPERDDPEADEAEDASPAYHDLLDEPDVPVTDAVPPATEDDGMPVSDDLADPVDADETLSGGGADDILTGHGGDDQVTGGAGGDLLGGRDGDDAIDGGAGEDYLHGGNGDDSLSGGHGDDVMHGEDGDDLATGGAGADRLYGHSGDDKLLGEAGADTLTGGEGQDSLAGGAGDDAVSGGIGDDLVVGGAGADALDGGEGRDTIWGQSADGDDEEVDFLNGGAGDDALMVGAGDYGSGGEGADQFALRDFGTGGDPAQITDFDPAEDQLVVLYDAALHPDPVLTLDQPDGTGAATLMIDGVPVASFANGADVDLRAIALRAA